MLLRGTSKATMVLSREKACSLNRTKVLAEKTLHLMRHGTTEMNEYLVGKVWDTDDFVDPMMYDTRLSISGIEQARKLQSIVAKLDPIPEIIVASPLTRAIHTADLVFENFEAPRVVCKLASERIYHAADIGRSPKQIREEAPHWEFVDLHEEYWWHYEESSGPHVPVFEPDQVFHRRMKELVEWIDSRPERSIAIVTHWGVLGHLTGKEFDNCEVMTTSLSSISKARSSY